MNQQPNLKEQIDLSKTTPISCDKCGGKTFEQSLLLRKMSAIVSPNGHEIIIPVQVFKCASCGHVNTEFVDSELAL